MRTIIASMDKNGLIGNSQGLPWHISDELKFFKRTTFDQVVIMGRNTWESLPTKPLARRVNVVVSTTMADPKTYDKLKVVSSVEAAIGWAEWQFYNKELFIIGGAKLYKAALDARLVDRLIISHVKGEYEGDVYFPCSDYQKDFPVKRTLYTHEDFITMEYSNGKNN